MTLSHEAKTLEGTNKNVFMQMGKNKTKQKQRIKLIWIGQFLSIISTSKNNKERLHIERSPL